jgi:hypothetical protein
LLEIGVLHLQRFELLHVSVPIGEFGKVKDTTKPLRSMLHIRDQPT